MKVVIVGGVAGGATAAARIRRLDEKAQIVLLERSGFISYANCGLPYYIGSTIQDADALTLQTPESFWKRFQVEARVGHEVLTIDRKAKVVAVQELSTGKTYTENYDKLILSPGAKPIRPQLSGIDNEKIYTLRTVEDTVRIRKAAESSNCKTAVIVGGGFIGVEMAENFRNLGMDVTLVEKQTQILGQFDSDMASFLHTHMKDKGIRLLLGKSVSGFETADQKVMVNIENAEPIQTDIVVLAIGVVPDSKLAKDAGLALGQKESIAVNDQMQTSDPDIYAVGDAVEVTHQVTGEKTLVSLAGPANKQGRIAADVICGLDSRYTGTAASSVLKVFDMTAASTGINERTARTANIQYEKVILSPASHASYYPGGKVMTMKVLFEKESQRILGAQIIGGDGVDKRIDVLATAMQANMQVSVLGELDLAYAPPYSSAKDPVNMVGFIAENIILGKVKQFYYEGIEDLPCDGSIILLDVRTDGEYKNGHAKGFETHIPIDCLRKRIHELDQSKPIYVMCQSGLRSYIACRILAQNGYDCYNFAGGYRFYKSVHLEKQSSNWAYPCGMEKSE